MSLPSYRRIFKDVMTEDGLLVMAKGVGLRVIIAKFLKLYSAGTGLVVVLNACSEILKYNEMLLADGLPSNRLPLLVDANTNAISRRALYARGGVIFATSRILVVDLLTQRLRTSVVAGFLVCGAERVGTESHEAFILQLYRAENSTGFVKAFSDDPESLTAGFGRAEKTLRALNVGKLFLWPRFQVNLARDLETAKPEVVEITSQLSPLQVAVQRALLQAMDAALAEIRTATRIDVDELTLENGLFESFDVMLRRKLDPTWNSVTPRIKGQIGDLGSLRKLLGYLTRYDSVSFFNFLDMLRINALAAATPGGGAGAGRGRWGGPSVAASGAGWLLTDNGERVFRAAKARLFSCIIVEQATHLLGEAGGPEEDGGDSSEDDVVVVEEDKAVSPAVERRASGRGAGRPSPGAKKRRSRPRQGRGDPTQGEVIELDGEGEEVDADAAAAPTVDEEEEDEVVVVTRGEQRAPSAPGASSSACPPGKGGQDADALPRKRKASAGPAVASRRPAPKAKAAAPPKGGALRWGRSSSQLLPRTLDEVEVLERLGGEDAGVLRVVRIALALERLPKWAVVQEVFAEVRDANRLLQGRRAEAAAGGAGAGGAPACGACSRPTGQGGGSDGGRGASLGDLTGATVLVVVRDDRAALTLRSVLNGGSRYSHMIAAAAGRAAGGDRGPGGAMLAASFRGYVRKAADRSAALRQRVLDSVDLCTPPPGRGYAGLLQQMAALPQDERDLLLAAEMPGWRDAGWSAAASAAVGGGAAGSRRKGAAKAKPAAAPGGSDLDKALSCVAGGSTDAASGQLQGVLDDLQSSVLPTPARASSGSAPAAAAIDDATLGSSSGHAAPGSSAAASGAAAPPGRSRPHVVAETRLLWKAAAVFLRAERESTGAEYAAVHRFEIERSAALAASVLATGDVSLNEIQLQAALAASRAPPSNHNGIGLAGEDAGLDAAIAASLQPRTAASSSAASRATAAPAAAVDDGPVWIAESSVETDHGIIIVDDSQSPSRLRRPAAAGAGAAAASAPSASNPASATPSRLTSAGPGPEDQEIILDEMIAGALGKITAKNLLQSRHAQQQHAQQRGGRSSAAAQPQDGRAAVVTTTTAGRRSPPRSSSSGAGEEGGASRAGAGQQQPQPQQQPGPPADVELLYCDDDDEEGAVADDGVQEAELGASRAAGAADDEGADDLRHTLLTMHRAGAGAGASGPAPAAGKERRSRGGRGGRGSGGPRGSESGGRRRRRSFEHGAVQQSEPARSSSAAGGERGDGNGAAASAADASGAARQSGATCVLIELLHPRSEAGAGAAPASSLPQAACSRCGSSGGDGCAPVRSGRADIMVFPLSRLDARPPLLEDVRPSFIVAYDPDPSFTREVEVYAAAMGAGSGAAATGARFSSSSSSEAGPAPSSSSHLPPWQQLQRVYFLVSSASAEEQRYLSALKKERSAFERLIAEKAHMAPPPPRTTGAAAAAVTDAIAIRKGGSDAWGITFDSNRMGVAASMARDGGIAGALSAMSNGRAGAVAGFSAALGPIRPLGVDIVADDKGRRRVVVDMREFRSKLPHRLYAIGLDPAPVTLEVGDYVLSPEMVVERKSVPDLIGSLSSGRLYSQAEAMVRAYSKPVLAIEFEEDRPFALLQDPLHADIEITSPLSKLVLLTLHFPTLRTLWCRSPTAMATYFASLKQSQQEPDVAAAAAVGSDGLVNPAALRAAGEEDEDGDADGAAAGEAGLRARPSPSDAPNLVALEMLRKLPGVNATNARALQAAVRSFADVARLSEAQLEAILGAGNAAFLHAFFHSKKSGSL